MYHMRFILTSFHSLLDQLASHEREQPIRKNRSLDSETREKLTFVFQLLRHYIPPAGDFDWASSVLPYVIGPSSDTGEFVSRTGWTLDWTVAPRESFDPPSSMPSPRIGGCGKEDRKGEGVFCKEPFAGDGSLGSSCTDETSALLHRDPNEKRLLVGFRRSPDRAESANDDSLLRSLEKVDPTPSDEPSLSNSSTTRRFPLLLCGKSIDGGHCGDGPL